MSNPPKGWFALGTHVAYDVPLVFSTELDDSGEPKWERPLDAVHHLPKTPWWSKEMYSVSAIRYQHPDGSLIIADIYRACRVPLIGGMLLVTGQPVKGKRVPWFRTLEEFSAWVDSDVELRSSETPVDRMLGETEYRLPDGSVTRITVKKHHRRAS